MFNIGPEHKRGHLVKAAYEGVAYNLRWILENYKRDFGFDPPVLKVIGGGALNPEWMQIISDVTKKRIEVPEYPEIAGAIGAAMCVAVGLGVCKSFSEVKNLLRIKSSYSPHPENFLIYDRLFASYQSLYFSLERVYREINSHRF
jgi:xylulokinase